jgi:hypothetical protein
VVDFVEAALLGELIKDVAEGNAKREEVPELGDGICGLAIVWGGEGEVQGKAANLHQPCAEG